MMFPIVPASIKSTLKTPREVRSIRRAVCHASWRREWSTALDELFGDLENSVRIGNESMGRNQGSEKPITPCGKRVPVARECLPSRMW